MLEQLSDRLQKTMKFLRGEGKITEKNMAEALRMMRMAFLEADVNYKVVKDFESRIKEQALDEHVLLSLSPAQQVIKIIRDEMSEILGHEHQKLNFSGHPPHIFMLVGLQGAGKTTTCGKLSKYVSSQGKSPLLVSFDIKRPAAQDQLQIIAKDLSVPFFPLSKEQMNDPQAALKDVVRFAQDKAFSPLIVDTAGRLHVDDELMNELQLARTALSPSESMWEMP